LKSNSKDLRRLLLLNSLNFSIFRIDFLTMHMALIKYVYFMIVDCTLIVVYHNGMIIMNEMGSYEFVGMKKETFIWN
jgi:hypothetical protein